MMTNTNKSTTRAVAALNSLLAQVSAITLKEIGLGWPVSSDLPQSEIDIIAHVEVYGHCHTLACQISSGSGAEDVVTALHELRSHIAYLPGSVTPVLIVPVLSPEVQAICAEHKTGCLDLRGNGRLAFDEVFISMRSLPRQALHQAAASSVSRRSGVAQPVAQSSAPGVFRGFPPANIALPHRGPHTAGHARTH